MTDLSSSLLFTQDEDTDDDDVEDDDDDDDDDDNNDDDDDEGHVFGIANEAAENERGIGMMADEIEVKERGEEWKEQRVMGEEQREDEEEGEEEEAEGEGEEEEVDTLENRKWEVRDGEDIGGRLITLFDVEGDKSFSAGST